MIVNKARKILIDGGLVIFPTETVYGLGADATNEKALKSIYKTKKRSANNPIICHFYNLKEIEKNFKLNSKAYKLAKFFWPGPLTLILEKKKMSKIKPILSNNTKFVGCRIPKHPIAKKLLKNLNFPIAAPSANISTKLSSTNINHLSKVFLNKIFIIDGGESLYGLESTVVDVTKKNAKILRLGSITFESLKKIIPNIKIQKKQLKKLSPGMMYKHYAPEKRIRINVKKVFKEEALLNFGINNLSSKIMELNLSTKGNLDEAAKNFYNFMHILDNSKSKKIAVAPIPKRGLGKAINDRLTRASSIK